MSIIEKAAGRIAHHASQTRSGPDASPRAFSPRASALPANQDAGSPEPGAPAKAASATARLDIDLDRLQKAGMVTPDAKRTPIAEAFRYIKRPLLSKALRKGEGAIRHGNLIMVTSSLPGEGKTFCSINLAMSIAMEMDHTVLLVDADVARPSVLSTLGLEARGGLMDLLKSETLNLSDVMIRTNVESLTLLPLGSCQQNATELLASQAMRRVLDEIASRYADRIVIFDSPPLLLTSEARVLAERMGQIVMVVEAEKTTQNAVRDALRKIDGCPNVSLVYNKGRAFAEPQSYGYYPA